MAEQKGNEPAVIVVKAYDFALWMLPKVEKFPRSYRFSVGDRLIASTLDVLLMLVESAYSSDQTKSLQVASQKLNAVRYLLRLSKDLKLMSVDSYGSNESPGAGRNFAVHEKENGKCPGRFEI